MNCDDCGIPVALPFPVTIYNQTFTSAIVGSNGVLSFGTAYDFAPSCMPVDSATYSIAPYWVDQPSGHFYMSHLWRVHCHYRHRA